MHERPHPSPGSNLPAFHATPQQRVALARERYFEEGVRPSGLVSEAVIQSWSRCLQAHRDPREAVAFNPVTASRVQSALQRSRQLLEAAASDLSQLQSVLAGTACTVILTDPQGVVVHSAWAGEHQDERLMPLARRIGVNLSEDCIGTNGPGLTARTGQASVVLGAEHFFGCVQVMHCAAAPIRDMHGNVAGVLDVSSESRPFAFDAAGMVGMYATVIENRLLRAQSRDHIVIHLQTAAGLLGTPMEGLVGVATDGSVAWMNGAAGRLLGATQSRLPLQAESVFGLCLASLAALTHEQDATAHRLPSGLRVWLLARMHASDGADRVFNLHRVPASPGAGPIATSSPPVPAVRAALPGAGTLRDSDLHVIEQKLAECAGNVSKTARQLGVSRGLIYRHLKQARASR